MLSSKLDFSKFWTFKSFCIAIYWPHNDHDASWQNTVHVNVSLVNFTMHRLFVLLPKDWLIDADTCLKINCLTSFWENLWLVTGMSSVLWPIRQTPFQLDQSVRNKFYDTLWQNLCFVIYYYQSCFSTHGDLKGHLDVKIKCQKFDFYSS